MEKKICSTCGGANRTNQSVCEYCGTLLIETDSVEEEIHALNELHNSLINADNKIQKKLLRNGFLPQNEKSLIEAGFKCIALMDVDDSSGEPSTSALMRLKAIKVKLKITANSKEAKSAISEFKNVISGYEKKSARNTVFGFILIGAVIAAIYFIFFR